MHIELVQVQRVAAIGDSADGALMDKVSIAKITSVSLIATG